MHSACYRFTQNRHCGGDTISVSRYSRSSPSRRRDARSRGALNCTAAEERKQLRAESAQRTLWAGNMLLLLCQENRFSEERPNPLNLHDLRRRANRISTSFHSRVDRTAPLGLNLAEKDAPGR